LFSVSWLLYHRYREQAQYLKEAQQSLLALQSNWEDLVKKREVDTAALEVWYGVVWCGKLCASRMNDMWAIQSFWLSITFVRVTVVGVLPAGFIAYSLWYSALRSSAEPSFHRHEDLVGL